MFSTRAPPREGLQFMQYRVEAQPGAAAFGLVRSRVRNSWLAGRGRASSRSGGCPRRSPAVTGSTEPPAGQPVRGLHSSGRYGVAALLGLTRGTQMRRSALVTMTAACLVLA